MERLVKAEADTKTKRIAEEKARKRLKLELAREQARERRFKDRLFKAIKVIDGHDNLRVTQSDGIYGEVASIWRGQSDSSWGVVCIQSRDEEFRGSDESPSQTYRIRVICLKFMLNDNSPDYVYVKVAGNRPSEEDKAIATFIEDLAPVLVDPRPLQSRLRGRSL